MKRLVPFVTLACLLALATCAAEQGTFMRTEDLINKAITSIDYNALTQLMS